MALLHEFSTCDDVLRFAASRGDKSWRYIILGRGGPTGKTHLCNKLCENGYNAIEITEDVYDLVDYNDNKNHYRIDYMKRMVVIILNKKLPEYIYPGKKNPNPTEFTRRDWYEVIQYDIRAEAEKILNDMKKIASRYGCATRADYMDLVGIESNTILDSKFGWVESELKKARIVPGPFGWFIEFPRAVPLLD